MEGWVTLHRKFLQWEWFDKPEMVQLFIWLLLNANYADKKWQGTVIKRGQLLTTTPKIMEALRLTERQTRTCISRLKSTGEVSVKTTNKYSIITICNYDRYQVDNFSNDGQNDGQSVTQATDKRRTNDGRLYDICTVNNNKTIKQLNNNISLCNDILDARACEDKERDIIFKIFFLKNFINPSVEVERFYNNYEAQGWVRGNGQKIVDRIAVAKHWEQEDKDKKRFPKPFIEAMREITEQPFYDPVMIRGIERIDIDATSLHLYCTNEAYKAIEKSPAKEVIKAKMQRQLQYRVKRTN